MAKRFATLPHVIYEGFDATVYGPTLADPITFGAPLQRNSG